MSSVDEMAQIAGASLKDRIQMAKDAGYVAEGVLAAVKDMQEVSALPAGVLEAWLAEQGQDGASPETSDGEASDGSEESPEAAFKRLLDSLPAEAEGTPRYAIRTCGDDDPQGVPGYIIDCEVVLPGAPGYEDALTRRDIRLRNEPLAKAQAGFCRWSRVLKERDQRLRATDYTQVADYPPKRKRAAKAYRAELWDIVREGSEPPSPFPWPLKPAGL